MGASRARSAPSACGSAHFSDRVASDAHDRRLRTPGTQPTVSDVRDLSLNPAAGKVDAIGADGQSNLRASVEQNPRHPGFGAHRFDHTFGESQQGIALKVFFPDLDRIHAPARPFGTESQQPALPNRFVVAEGSAVGDGIEVHASV